MLLHESEFYSFLKFNNFPSSFSIHPSMENGVTPFLIFTLARVSWFLLTCAKSTLTCTMTHQPVFFLPLSLHRGPVLHAFDLTGLWALVPWSRNSHWIWPRKVIVTLRSGLSGKSWYKPKQWVGDRMGAVNVGPKTLPDKSSKNVFVKKSKI